MNLELVAKIIKIRKKIVFINLTETKNFVKIIMERLYGREKRDKLFRFRPIF